MKRLLVALLAATLLLPIASASAVTTRSAPRDAACLQRDLARVPRGHTVRAAVNLGAVTARLTGRSRNRSVGADEGNALLRHAKLTVRGAGRSSTYRIPVSRYFRPKATYLAKIRVTGGGGFLCLVRFTAGAAPVAVVGRDPGCMGGCPDLLFMAPAGERSSLQTGPDGQKIVIRPQRSFVLTDDPRFFGEFSDDADAVDPLRVVTYRGDGLDVITSHFTGRLNEDAHRDYRDFVHPSNGPHDGLGALAAWAADRCSLGKQTQAFHKLHRLLAAGRLKGYSGWPQGKHYVHHLERFLRKTGYVR